MSKKIGHSSTDHLITDHKMINKDKPFVEGETDPLRLLHELQVHRIELESQNEELITARNNAESAAASYTDLYDFAPVGYLTLNTDGFITRANHASARLLGAEREHLQGKNLAHYVVDASIVEFTKLIKNSVVEGHLPAYEITLNGNGSSTVLMEVSSNENALEKRLILTDISARKLIEKKLKEREFWLSETQRVGFIGSYALDMLTDEWVSSTILEQIFGFHIDCDKSTAKWIERILPDDRAGLLDNFSKEFALKSKLIDKEYRIVRANDGELRWVWQHGEITYDMGGKPSRIIGTIQDITERKHAQVKLQLAASVFTHAHEGIIITDAKGSILDVNSTFTHITGFTREDAVGQIARELLSDNQSPELHASMWQSVAEKGYWNGEIWTHRKNGERFPEMISISAVKDISAKTLHYVSLITDITDLKAHQNQLEHAAHYDALTNLPNRALLAQRLPHALLEHQRNGKMLAVVYLDLDGFKVINDTHGHGMGDQLLIKLSQRMSEALREGDTLARIGGDEFVAIIGNLDEKDDCKPVLDRLLHATSKAAMVNDTRLKVTASIGASIYPLSGDDADLLLRQADQAMYLAKGSDKNCYHFFDIHSATEQRHLHDELRELRYALEQNQFLLYYQPKINMKTGDFVGVEALIRWRHPERGLLAPIEFLHLVEEHEIRIEVGDWVINTALAQMSHWNESDENISVSVNVGAYQLQDKNFFAKLETSLSNHSNVHPSQFELEILETSALTDVAKVSALLQKCQCLGVDFSLDDFGTGYSSLTYLKRLPVGSIKIDQSFVRDMLNDSDDMAIVKGVISLANAFKREVIAEGVETYSHGEMLLSLGCEIAQGYGIARPMPAAELPFWIEQWQAKQAWTA